MNAVEIEEAGDDAVIDNVDGAPDADDFESDDPTDP